MPATMALRAGMTNFECITVDPAQMGGVPCVRHLRIPFATVLRLLAGGLSEQQILSEYPYLQTGDIRECLRFAAASVMERELRLSRTALKFLVDNALPPLLAELLVKAGHDAVHVRDYAMQVASDDVILAKHLLNYHRITTRQMRSSGRRALRARYHKPQRNPIFCCPEL